MMIAAVVVAVLVYVYFYFKNKAQENKLRDLELLKLKANQQ